MSFFSELKRRNVFRVGATYAVLAWILMQVADIVLPTFNAPGWVLQAFLFFLFLGLPVALVVSWVYELTPDGIRATAEVDPAASIRVQTGHKLNYITVGSVALLLVFILLDRATLSEPRAVPAAESPPGADTTTAAPPVTAPTGIIPDSLAVLPFANISPNADDAYFAIGLHDEILNQLAKIGSLKVISRQSVLRYAESNLSIPEIAKELRVTNIMEGSVRYAGDRIRVTVQLIAAATDEHLWAQTFDLAFADVFAIESQVAMEVANAMKVSFSPAEQAQIARIPTSSPQAYALYLNANSKVTGGQAGFTARPVLDEMLVLLDRAIALDPDFALAYGAKAGIYQAMGANDLAAAAILKAVALNPDLIDLDLESVRQLLNENRESEAAPLVLAMLQRRPNDQEVLVLARELRMRQGHNSEALTYAVRIQELFPDNPGINNARLGLIHTRLGQYDLALSAFERALLQNVGGNNTSTQIDMAGTLAAMGRQTEALTWLQSAEVLGLGANGESGNPNLYSALIYAYALAGSTADAERLFSGFQPMEAQADLPTRARAYLGFGNHARALELMQQMATDKSTSNNASHLALAILRDNPHKVAVLNRPEFVEARSKL